MNLLEKQPRAYWLIRDEMGHYKWMRFQDLVANMRRTVPSLPTEPSRVWESIYETRSSK